MTAATLDGKSLGNVQNIQSDKTANIQQISLPGDNSDQAILFDLLGVTKVITVNGIWTGTTAAIKVLIGAIEDLCDGDQNIVDFIFMNGTTTVKVMVGGITTTWEYTGIESSCSYVVKLLEGI